MFNAPPFIDRRHYQTRRQKLLTFAAIVLLSIFAFFSGINMIIYTSAIIIDGMDQAHLVAAIVNAAIFAVSAVSLFVLVRLYRRPLEFGVPLTDIPPTVQGHPLAVRFRQNLLGASFRRRGVIQFLPDQLIVEGPREIKLYLQVAVILALIVVSKVQVELGVAFFWAVAIAVSLIGSKKYVQAVPYQAISSVRQKGKWVTIECPGLRPRRIVFSVGADDRQRLHGEIDPRFAAMLAAR